MNKIIINTTEIESIWEKDNICFVKMKSGKVWLCKDFIKTATLECQIKTKDYIATNNGLIELELTTKGKCE